MNGRLINDVCPAKHGQAVRIEFRRTRINILIPIFIATGAFLVEILSLYFFNAHEAANATDIIHLINTTFIPTHIATTTCFLYEHFSQANWLFSKGVDWNQGGSVLRPQYTSLTVFSTCALGFAYVLLNVRVTFITQLILMVLQIIYMIILFKIELEDKVLIYEKPIKNVITSK